MFRNFGGLFISVDTAKKDILPFREVVEASSSRVLIFDFMLPPVPPYINLSSSNPIIIIHPPLPFALYILQKQKKKKKWLIVKSPPFRANVIGLLLLPQNSSAAAQRVLIIQWASFPVFQRRIFWIETTFWTNSWVNCIGSVSGEL